MGLEPPTGMTHGFWPWLRSWSATCCPNASLPALAYSSLVTFSPWHLSSQALLLMMSYYRHILVYADSQTSAHAQTVPSIRGPRCHDLCCRICMHCGAMIGGRECAAKSTKAARAAPDAHEHPRGAQPANFPQGQDPDLPGLVNCARPGGSQVLHT